MPPARRAAPSTTCISVTCEVPGCGHRQPEHGERRERGPIGVGLDRPGPRRSPFTRLDGAKCTVEKGPATVPCWWTPTGWSHHPGKRQSPGGPERSAIRGTPLYGIIADSTPSTPGTRRTARSIWSASDSVATSPWSSTTWSSVITWTWGRSSRFSSGPSGRDRPAGGGRHPRSDVSPTAGTTSPFRVPPDTARVGSPTERPAGASGGQPVRTEARLRLHCPPGSSTAVDPRRPPVLPCRHRQCRLGPTSQGRGEGHDPSGRAVSRPACQVTRGWRSLTSVVARRRSPSSWRVEHDQGATR